MSDFFNAEVWESIWKEESEVKRARMKKNGIDFTRSFDAKAQTFDQQSFSKEGKERSRRIMGWLEGQGVTLDNASVLDIGAASGVFSVPFAERGAKITAIETSPPLIDLLKQNTSDFADGQVQIVPSPFEEIDVTAMGWDKSFDLVFVSMCPVIHDWESVEKLLQCASKFCYLSMPVVPSEHNLVKEVWPLVTDQPYPSKLTEMGYLLHLLYLKGYSYESLVTREGKSKEVTREVAIQEVMTWLEYHHRLPMDDHKRKIVSDYLAQAYPSDRVVIREEGRYGKVLIRLEDQSMYTLQSPPAD
ncbi:class I SAM-dependent methyltransferase [Paenibacillus senegalimassiliensis]|uniref:class I SAM-dependent methyltransferase n=1 Tax=Paenibacillus senegalimassiliensis TaxID=1737426 RepID=UPI00073EC0A9|nr:class I SAM-dependent methyltransferase [Paenibacillus senegalimassiliensis]